MDDREPVLVLGQEVDPVADAAEMQRLADEYEREESLRLSAVLRRYREGRGEAA